MPIACADRRLPLTREVFQWRLGYPLRQSPRVHRSRGAERFCARRRVRESDSRP